MVLAIILCAGSGTRLGGICKGLLCVNGEPLIRRQLRIMREAGIDQSIVVVGHQAEAISRMITDLPGVDLVNVGQTSDLIQQDVQASVRAGLQHVIRTKGHEATHLLICLTDLPLLAPQHVRRVIDRLCAGQALAVIPTTADGVVGHPLGLCWQSLQQETINSNTFSLRQWLFEQAQRPGALDRFLTDDPAYFTDVDTPEDLARINAAFGIEIRLPKD